MSVLCVTCHVMCVSTFKIRGGGIDGVRLVLHLSTRLHVPHFVPQQPTDLRNSFSCKDFKEIREFNSGQASEQGTL